MARIGVFDSGIGGLTVLKELAQAFPNESFLYLGDTARLPYGTKSPETIRKYSVQIMSFLISKNVDAIVIACNTASSQVPELEWRSVPVFNVIDPGAKLAVKLSKNKKIGILGTRATIESESYKVRIQSIDPAVEVFSQACPLFVPLVEEGMFDDSITDQIIARYIGPILRQDVDTIVLGCTHYPLLTKAIQKCIGSGVTLVNSGISMCSAIDEAFEEERIKRGRAPRTLEFYATDLPEHTRSLAEKILSPLLVDVFAVTVL